MSMASHMSESVEPMRIPHVGLLRRIWGAVWGGDTKDSEDRIGYV